jgi:hypothetical protein
MQALIREFRERFVLVLLIASASTLLSCATQKDQPLVSDPSEKKESLVPWNKPESWESGGNLAGMTDRR